jgi:hypothetical protein
VIMMTGRLASARYTAVGDDLGDRVTAESPGTMISALAAVPYFYAGAAAWQLMSPRF